MTQPGNKRLATPVPDDKRELWLELAELEADASGFAEHARRRLTARVCGDRRAELELAELVDELRKRRQDWARLASLRSRRSNISGASVLPNAISSRAVSKQRCCGVRTPTACWRSHAATSTRARCTITIMASSPSANGAGQAEERAWIR